MSDHAVQIETDRLLGRFTAAADTDELLTIVESELQQANTTLATGNPTKDITVSVDHHNSRLTKYCIGGGPLDTYFTGVFSRNAGARTAFSTLLAEAFADPVPEPAGAN